jgi:hypothetical protein
MLYALTNKEKPVYINQSVLHLSGEDTQEAFIEEIENFGENCSYALLGGFNDLDGIENPVKYYEVWEYLNEEFRPLCSEQVHGFSLWVRKEKYESAREKVLTYVSEGDVYDFPLIDYSFYNHRYALGDIPYLWGEYDSRKAYENPKVYTPQSLPGIIPKDMQSHENYMLLRINANQDDTGILAFGSEAGDYNFGYSFRIKEGNHSYLFRVSADNYWTLGNLIFNCSSENGSQVVGASVLEGD